MTADIDAPPRTPDPPGFLALPLTGTGPGVLVLHAWWGLNDTIKAVCMRLAEAGYVAYAPDLYRGETAETVADAERLGAALDAEHLRAKADIARAVDHLGSSAAGAGTGLAVLGYSLGACYALDLAAARPDAVRSVVLFYGTGGGDWRTSRADYLGHFASDDPYEPPANVDALERALLEAGRAVTVHRYAGVGHWFCEPDRADAYDQPAADLAWQRTLAFLRRPTAA